MRLGAPDVLQVGYVGGGGRLALGERHLAGPQVVALISALSLRMRLSCRRAPEFRADWLGPAVNAATTRQLLHLARRALRDWVVARPLSYGTCNAERSTPFTTVASVI